MLAPDFSCGFQIVQLHGSAPRPMVVSGRRYALLEALEVDIDTGTISVIELEVVVGKLGEDSATRSVPFKHDDQGVTPSS